MIFQIIQQIILGTLFLFLGLLIFFFPGFNILKISRINLEGFIEKFTVASVIGIAAFTLTAYILAALNLRLLMWLFPVWGILVFLKYKIYRSSFNLHLNSAFSKWFLLILLVGIIGQVAVNAPSGFIYQDGIYFYSSHGHDGVWHLSLMEEMKKNVFPFQNPEYAGHTLQNYHFFVDLLMSEMSRLFYFSNTDVYFRFMPVIFSLLLGLGSFILVKKWSGSETAGLWAMFFSYFVGSFGYLVTLPRQMNLSGETIFWVSQTHSSIGNPPHAAAFVIIITILFLLLKLLNGEKNWPLLLFITFLSGVIIEFKIYAGLLILGGLLVVAINEALLKRSLFTLYLFLSSFFLSLLIYLPNSQNSQEFLIWQPWWYIRTMVVAPDRLNWLDLELRRQTYIAENNLKRVVQLELTAFLIFLLGNLGMRIIGFYSVFKFITSNLFKNPFNLFFISITFASFFIPVFFLQKGVAWNTIQFNQYFLLFFGFLGALSTARILNAVKYKFIKIFLIITLIVLSVPTQIGLLLQFYGNLPLSKVSFANLEAFNFLRNSSSEFDRVLTAPFDGYKKSKYYPPVPIYTWYDTGYVPAFSGRRTVLSDREQINIMGYDIKDLLKERDEAFMDADPEKLNYLLRKYKVNFIYLEPDQNFNSPVDELNIEQIYANQGIKIYKVI